MKKIIKNIIYKIKSFLIYKIKSFLIHYIKRVLIHLRTFPFIWVLLVLLPFIFLFFSWNYIPWFIYLILFLLFLLLIFKPLGAVYGLLGTTGSIQLFFVISLVISFLFSLVYYWGFFEDAGISYDNNQPHIDYNYFANSEDGKPRIKHDTIFIEHQIDGISFKETLIRETRDSLHYQRIGFIQLWRSTILTTLTQEPTDLLANAAAYNTTIESSQSDLDKQMSITFEWVLIFHILISWIFFGVFISLLYTKFRHES